MTLILDAPGRRLTEGERTMNLRESWVRILIAASRHSASGKLSDFISAIYPDYEPGWAESTIKVQVFHFRRALNNAGFDPLIVAICSRGFVLTRALTILRPDAPDIVIPADLAPELRRLLAGRPLSDRLLAVVGA